ncbi:hypothetical protein [Motiliproteus sp. MSK22-1]|uniref:hypothetical protein n=1 Tax=Motiliproteus sp. MSK22-1 TaxID=1897630 RepID=UPI00097868CC|nr:hypothetical protein [Motiliproteus sp. MSK22-1]OMH38201.1 hypothetical protein BGP75_08080 [Motiliproteus sp. MSK22-1]
MNAHDIGSWIIAITFAITCAYLIYEGKRYQPLSLLGYLATALMMCFSGLLFTGAASYAVSITGSSLNNEILLGLLVSVGVFLAMLVRHRWNRSKE